RGAVLPDAAPGSLSRHGRAIAEEGPRLLGLRDQGRARRDARSADGARREAAVRPPLAGVARCAAGRTAGSAPPQDTARTRSKRHGAVSVMHYRDEGYLPDAMVNYLARLGWSHGDEEVFSREQLVEWFDLEHVSKSPARWDPEKLKWLNGEYLRRMSDADLA